MPNKSVTKITYEVNGAITLDEFIQFVNDSGLGKRRPASDIDCINGILKHDQAWVLDENDQIE